MAIGNLLIRALVSLVVFTISALPLHFAVKFLKGRTNIIKTVIVAFMTGIIVAAIEGFFNTFGGLIAFFVLYFLPYVLEKSVASTIK